MIELTNTETIITEVSQIRSPKTGSSNVTFRFTSMPQNLAGGGFLGSSADTNFGGVQVIRSLLFDSYDESQSRTIIPPVEIIRNPSASGKIFKINSVTLARHLYMGINTLASPSTINTIESAEAYIQTYGKETSWFPDGFRPLSRTILDTTTTWNVNASIFLRKGSLVSFNSTRRTPQLMTQDIDALVTSGEIQFISDVNLSSSAAIARSSSYEGPLYLKPNEAIYAYIDPLWTLNLADSRNMASQISLKAMVNVQTFLP